MTLYENDLTPAVYNALRESVGWTPHPADRAAPAWNCGWAGCNRYQMPMCAERNAIANMITNGETQIKKIVAVMPDGKAGMPCGACREFMMQLSQSAGETEILCDYETKTVTRLESLTPEWWYTGQSETNG